MSTRGANKPLYNQFCDAHPEMPLFLQPWWLDVVCEKGQWNACLATDGAGQVLGVMPYYQRRQWSFDTLRMPPLTPYQGAWLLYPPTLKPSRIHSFEKKVLEQLIGQLPKFAYYAQCHPRQLQNWLPFYWQGYRQTTRYSFVLEDLSKLGKVEQGLDSAVRNKIRKAQRQVNVEETEDIALFYSINTKTFARQNIAVPYSFSFFKRLDAALVKQGRRSILLAKDQVGQCHAAIYLIWDDRVMYNLALGADPNYHSSGAVQLLLWEGIQMAAQKGMQFDFEGSMMKNIESLFAAFGGKAKPYFKIFKSQSRLLKVLLAAKNIR